LGLGLRAIHQERADVADVEAVRQHILAVPIETLPQQRSWLPHFGTGGFDRFSALKFVAAAVIVALFGGVLLTGILTSPEDGEAPPAAVSASPTAESEPDEVTKPPAPQPSPMTMEELLSGMVTVEVEPGVFRILNDGVRDLAPVKAVDIVAGYDGGIRLLRKDEFLRLGGDGSHEWPDVSFATPRDPHAHPILEVTPDGTMWAIPRWTRIWLNEPRLGSGHRSTDGEEWTVVEPRRPEGSIRTYRGFTVAPDGRVWASWPVGGDQGRVGHLGPMGWQPLEGYSPGWGFKRLFITDAGNIYGFVDGWSALYRYQEKKGAWKSVAGGWTALDVGRDGTIWQRGGEEDGVSDLTRFADGERDYLTSADFLPDIGYGLGLDGQFRVAPDGSLWSSLWPTADGDPPEDDDWRTEFPEDHWVCDGLVRFDGDRLDRFLRGRCISMDIAPDGSVWVLAADKGVWGYDAPYWYWALPDDHTWDLYVITPEAVAAVE
jgi:hypothetical protein